jgi:ribonuclease P protein component
VLDQSSNEALFAFATPRKVGSAVVRNRVRRQMKAALPDLAPAPGLYLVLVRPDVGTDPVRQLRRALAKVAE